MGDLDEQKKQILPYLQRAEEIQQVEPKVAYYSRVYAVDQGLKMQNRAKEITQLLSSVINKLEKEKASIELDLANDKYYCEQFALTIFKRADKVDRAGRADLNTSKAFYAAAVFLEVCSQFGEPDNDLKEKQMYSVWRAAEIRKAIREGRPPVPPPSTPESAAEGSTGSAPGAAAAAAAPADAAAALFNSLPEARPQPPAGGSVPGAAAGMASSSAPSSSFNIPNTLPSEPGDAGGWHGGPPSMVQPPPPQPPAAGQAAPSRYRPGSKVLFCQQPGHMAPEPGTVAKVLMQPAGPPHYMVALRDRIAEAAEHLLVAEIPEGSRVLANLEPSAPPMAATVLGCDLRSWPPTYSLKCDDGYDVDAQAHELTLLGQDGSVVGPLPGGAGAPPPRLPYGAPQQGFAAPPSPWGPPGAPDPPPMYPGAWGGEDLASSRMGGSAPSPPPNAPGGGYPSLYGMSGGSAPAAPPSAPQLPAHASAPPRPAPHPTQPSAPPPQAPPPAATSVSIPAPVPGYQPPLATITEAQKYTKYAASSLAFEDVASAVKYLTDALKLLTQPGAVVGHGKH